MSPFELYYLYGSYRALGNGIQEFNPAHQCLLQETRPKLGSLPLTGAGFRPAQGAGMAVVRPSGSREIGLRT